MAPDEKATPLWRSLANSAAAASIAEATTLPLDTAKVRLQLQSIREASSNTAVEHKYRGPLQTAGRLVADEGARAPFKGLVAGIHRQFIFTGLRLGLYDKVRNQLAGSSEHAPLQARIAAALMTSAVGILIANPADVVKVRMQACTGYTSPRQVLQAIESSAAFSKAGREAAAAPSQPTYSSAVRAYGQILREEGLQAGLYRGFAANLIRNSVISATELVSYDTAKALLLDTLGLPEGVGVHFMAGLSAGLAATALGSPADVVGTRLMAQARATGEAQQSLPSFCMRMLREEGVSAFYKGFIPNFARIGSFNIVLWLSYEQIRAM
ncbi:hypothetical protein WJX74_008755 [Apatococcus lobatus]|uniref:Uncharacterized protein n=2 Tax=Apatococcus TaxID=904362 RepID=A0AAW1T3M0_9CHLO